MCLTLHVIGSCTSQGRQQLMLTTRRALPGSTWHKGQVVVKKRVWHLRSVFCHNTCRASEVVVITQRHS